MSVSYQLSKKIIIRGKIILLTGLHIGGTNSAMSIGGMDKSVIRNPLTNKPYIPGSSLKGKMRSLVELSLGTIGNNSMGGHVKNAFTENPDDIAAQLFGTARNDERQRPSRVIVRDAHLTSSDEDFANTDLPYTESKTEVVIDRITSAAMPRQIERVPAGAEFSLEIVLNIFENDPGKNSDDPKKKIKVVDESTLLKNLIGSLQLVQDDYLGGNGSRGHGQVKFEIKEVLERPKVYYLTGEGERDITQEANVPAELMATQKTAAS